MGDHVQAPELLTRDEVAGRLKLSVVTVDRLRRQHELESVKLGRAVRIPLHSVVAFLAIAGGSGHVFRGLQSFVHGLAAQADQPGDGGDGLAVPDQIVVASVAKIKL